MKTINSSFLKNNKKVYNDSDTRIVTNMSLSNVCKKCILPSNYIGSNFNSDGFCKYCVDNSYTGKKRDITNEGKKQLANELDNILRNCKKSDNKYDVAIGFSGGKDSTYLAWKLINEYQLKVLGIVIDHSYFPTVVESNIKNVSEKLNLDIIYHKIDPNFMNKFFKAKFENYKKFKSPIFNDVCGDCSNIIEGNVMKIAANMNIPYVFIGLSPEQTNRYFYKLDEDHVKESWIKDFFLNNDFTDSEKANIWNPTTEQELNLQVYLPFHVWDYNVEYISEFLEENKILSVAESEALNTECKILHTIRFLDSENFGYDPRIAPFSDLTRENNANREDMINKFYNFSFDPEIINEVHEKLEL